MSIKNIISGNAISSRTRYHRHGVVSVIADRIKALRESCSWTQSELAKRLGITRSSVNAWEMGLSVPSTQYIAELVNLFKVSADYLLGINAKVIVDISSLTEDEQAVVIGLVNCFNKKK